MQGVTGWRAPARLIDGADALQALRRDRVSCPHLQLLRLRVQRLAQLLLIQLRQPLRNLHGWPQAQAPTPHLPGTGNMFPLTTAVSKKGNVQRAPDTHHCSILSESYYARLDSYRHADLMHCSRCWAANLLVAQGGAGCGVLGSLCPLLVSRCERRQHSHLPLHTGSFLGTSHTQCQCQQAYESVLIEVHGISRATPNIGEGW